METPFAVCGNGIVEGGEECDDGTRTDGGGCNAKCQVLHRFMLHRQVPGACLPSAAQETAPAPKARATTPRISWPHCPHLAFREHLRV